MLAVSDGPSLLTLTSDGLFCPAGDFYIDPWRPVDRAVITHAHSDHARSGSRQYLTSDAGRAVLRVRMGPDAAIETVAYGERVMINGVAVSFHPAGHILGSAQVRIERQGEVWVVTGDYKVEADATCAPFEPVRCHVFITESTFGLPVYRWPRQTSVFSEVNAWWRANQQHGKASVLFAYALGKAQRLLAGVDAQLGPIYTHGAVEKLNAAYRESGIKLPTTIYARADARPADWSRALILAPPSAAGTPWMRKFGSVSSAFASGWMQIRGARRRRAVDRGFVLSDHADWPGLLSAIEAAGAERVLVTHGYTEALARWVRERGLCAETVRTEFRGERDDATEVVEENDA
jgi:putative mRNA 3-end processing factor